MKRGKEREIEKVGKRLEEKRTLFLSCECREMIPVGS